MERALSIHQLFNKKRNVLPFSGAWLDHIGKPERRGSWMIWGHSGNGKTSYSLQLAKYLAGFGRVAYNALEEGDSESFALGCKRVGMQEVARRFVVIQDKYENLIERLNTKGAPNIVFIDSFQYLCISYQEYIKLIESFPSKLFVWISHADGKHPEGRVAKRIRYDAFVKISVEGYCAQAVSRYGGGAPYIVWKQGAQKARLSEEK